MHEKKKSIKFYIKSVTIQVVTVLSHHRGLFGSKSSVDSRVFHPRWVGDIPTEVVLKIVDPRIITRCENFNNNLDYDKCKQIFLKLNKQL